MTSISIYKDSGQKYFYCANVGNRRVTLVRHDGSILRLSYDYKAKDPSERQMIIKSKDLYEIK